MDCIPFDIDGKPRDISELCVCNDGFSQKTVNRSCFLSGQGPVCECYSGWQGPTCESYRCSSGCNGHGTCSGPEQCSCADGWSGAQCEKFYCPGDCGGHGYCSGPRTCTCSSGWTGPDCRTKEGSGGNEGGDNTVAVIVGGGFLASVFIVGVVALVIVKCRPSANGYQPVPASESIQ
eukprot:m51a1_g10242 putative protein (177) ;mRNA; f:29741-30408